MLFPPEVLLITGLELRFHFQEVLLPVPRQKYESEPFLFSAFRQIVNKIHVSNILMKIAGIFYIKDIGVLFYVPLCLGFGKCTFSDSGDSTKKNMTVFLKHGI